MCSGVTNDSGRSVIPAAQPIDILRRARLVGRGRRCIGDARDWMRRCLEESNRTPPARFCTTVLHNNRIEDRQGPALGGGEKNPPSSRRAALSS